jgi:hypothetical protein
MRKTLSLVLALGLVGATAPQRAAAQGAYPASQPMQDPAPYDPFSAPQLDNLLAPVALYPDALLAQVLVAATFPDQIDEASRWVHANGATRLDDQWWDVSVRAVAHYPTVLYMMASRMDWTTSLGQAYVSQSTDVMESVQRLRVMANSQGNLVSTPEQQVIMDGGYVEIVPAQPQIIYVPVYDPTVIYFRRAYMGGGFGGFWSFGAGFAIGSWLSYDVDWRARHVYYDGWRGTGWRAKARPFIQQNSVYVNPRLESVNVNRDVIRRPVNVSGIQDYNTVHRTTTFDNRIRPTPAVVRPNSPVITNPVNSPPVNRVIERNVNTQDPQVNNHRGWQTPAPQLPRATAPVQSTPVQPSPVHPTPVQPTPVQPTPVQPAPAPVQQPPKQTGQPMPMQRPQPLPPQMTPRPVPVQIAPPTTVPPRATPAPPPMVPPPHPFGTSEGAFDPRAASQRGQASRAPQVQRPAPQPPPPQQQQPRTARPVPPDARKRPQ